MSEDRFIITTEFLEHLFKANQETSIMMRVLAQRIDTAEKSIELLEKTIHIGDGKESLSASIALNKQGVLDLREKIKELVEIFEKHQRKYDQNLEELKKSIQNHYTTSSSGKFLIITTIISAGAAITAALISGFPLLLKLFLGK